MSAALDDWRRCAAAGMTMAEAAAHRGVSVKAAYMVRWKHGIEFRKEVGRRGPSRREHPMTREWRECAEAGMTAMQAAEKLGRSQFTGRGLARRHGFRFAPARPGPKPKPAPKRDVLAELTAVQREDYRTFRKHHFTRAEALVKVGRADLVEA